MAEHYRDSIPSMEGKQRGLWCSPVVNYLPNTQETLSLIPSTLKKKSLPIPFQGSTQLYSSQC